MKRIFTFVILLSLLYPLCAQSLLTPTEIPLWPEGAPTQSGITEPEKEVYPAIHFITNVTNPVLYVYKAAHPNGLCVICCPGGGYFGLSMEGEGKSMADWMTKMGVTFVVLKYRMPNGHPEIPLNDGEQAIRLVRQHAQEWGVNPSKVGIMGSSAGGHFAATLSTLYTSEETRPDFSILLYPVISMKDELTHAGSKQCLMGKTPTAQLVEHYCLDLQVNEQTPPAFLVLASDDSTVNPQNSILYYSALQKHGIKNCSMFIYPTGGHGFGYNESFLYKRQWTEELETWLKSL